MLGSGVVLKRAVAMAAIGGRELEPTDSVETTVAGKQYFKWRFRWDGRDVTGRVINGRQLARVRVGFVYPGTYSTTTGFAEYAAGGTLVTATGDPTRMEATLWREQNLWVDAWDDAIQQLGGWSLTPVHYLDVAGKAVYRGDGGMQVAEAGAEAVETIAGGGGTAASSGLNALSASLPSDITAIALAPDRAVYFGTYYDGIWKIEPDRTKADGGWSAAKLYLVVSASVSGAVQGLAFDRSGSLLFSTTDNRVFRYTTAAGKVAIAGTGTAGFTDNVAPLSAQLDNPRELAVGADGAIYIADFDNHRVRRIDPTESVITTIAGTGANTATSPSFVGAATSMTFHTINGIAVRPDGNILVADQSQVFRITPDGYARIFVGGGSSSYVDGIDAKVVGLNNVNGVTLAADGTALLAHQSDASKCMLRRVESDTLLRTVAGSSCFATTDGPALDALLDGLGPITASSQGDIFFVNSGSSASTRRIRRVRTAMNIVATTSGEYRVASSDGREVYYFDSHGIHQRTVDGVSGQTLLTFNHSTTDASLLTQIVDRDGKVTKILRPSSTVVEIEAPSLHKTTLNLTGPEIAGRSSLASVADFSGTSRFEYHWGTRLLSVFKDQLADATSASGATFTYDADGLLYYDSPAQGGLISLQRANETDGWSVTMNSAAGRRKEYRVRSYPPVNDPGGTPSFVPARSVREHVDPAGLTTTSTTQVPSTGGLAVTNTVFPDVSSALVSPAADPRYGLASAYPQSIEFTAAPGKIAKVTRAITVLPNGASDPTEVTNLTRTVTLHEGTTPRTWTSIYANSSGTRTRTRTSPLGRQVVAASDSADRTKSVSISGLADVTYGYDAAGRVTLIQQGTCGSVAEPTAAASCTTAPSAPPSGCRRVRFGYEATTGFLACMYDPLNRRSDFQMDPYGRPTLIKTPAGPSASSPSQQQISASYAANGTTTVTVPNAASPSGATHTFTVNRPARTHTYAPPLVGTSADDVTLDVDPDREFKNLLRPLSWGDISLTYENGPTSGTKSSLPADALFGHSGDTTQYKHDWVFSLGRLEHETRFLDTAQEAKRSTTWDRALPESTTVTVGTGTGSFAATIGRTFDALLRLETQTPAPPDGSASNILFGYDGDGMLASVGALSIERLASPTTLRADGQISKTIVGGTSEAFVRDAQFGEVTGVRGSGGVVTTPGVEDKHGASTVLSFTYDRDALGRITRITEKITAPGSGGSIGGLTETSFEFLYRHEGWLENVVHRSGVSGSAIRNTTYTYDANGNRTTDKNGATCTHDAQDRLLSCGSTSYNFDRNGFLRTRTDSATTTFTYDAIGSLVSAGSVSYKNDTRGRRVMRDDGTQQTAYLYEDAGLLPIADYRKVSGSFVMISRYVYGSRPNAPDYVVRGTKTYRIFTDHLGSPRLVIDADSTATNPIVQRTDYDEWGNATDVFVASGWEPIPFGFAGGLYDRATKLVRFGARDYDPAIGRWLAKDPSAFAGGGNLYAYAVNDPVNLIDQQGRFPVPLATGAIGGGFALGVNLLSQAAAVDAARRRGEHAEIDLRAATVAFGYGFMNGALLPLESMNGVNLFAAGFFLGIAQSLTNNYVTGTCYDLNAAFVSGLLGGVGNSLGGAFTWPNPGSLPPIPIGVSATSHFSSHALRANLNGFSLLRGGIGSYVGGSSIDP